MRKHFILGLLLLLFVSAKAQFRMEETSPDLIRFDAASVANYDERIIVLHAISEDTRFSIIEDEEEGVFLIANEQRREENFMETFSDFLSQVDADFQLLDKVEASELASRCKQDLPESFMTSLTMNLLRSTNNSCATAQQICFADGSCSYPAGVNAGSGESGPNYNCLGTTPNPAWFYLRVLNPGNINIYMYATPSYDIDFCCWGPFYELGTPCPNQLTANKVVSCSYSASSTENCIIPSAQPNEYYYIVITNYSNQPCNIFFNQTGGTGSINCYTDDFYATSDSPVCYGSDLHLYASTNENASYSWSGPNGWTSNQRNPSRANATTAIEGTYYCTISTPDTTATVSCEVSVSPKAVADFSCESVCLGDTMQFHCLASTMPSGLPITSVLWVFGDGTTSTELSPKHCFTTAGTHSVSMTASVENGCSDTKTKTATVYSLPVANAGNDRVIRTGASTSLSGNGGSETFSYHWSPENMVIDCNAQTTETVNLTETQAFVLTVTSLNDCGFSRDTVVVTVDQNPVEVEVTVDNAELCYGGSTQLHAVGSNGTGNYTYSWQPTTGLSNPQVSNPVISSIQQTTTYSCTINDGVTFTTASATVLVHPFYYVIQNVDICQGDTYYFKGQELTESGLYLDEHQSIYGCDSICGVQLSVHEPVYNEFSATACNSYVWNNEVFTQSGDYQRTLSSPIGCDSIVTLHLTIENCNHWTPDISQFSDNMNIIGVASLDDEELTSPKYEIGAFCGEQCRGVGTLLYNPILDRYFVFLTIGGESNDPISFRLFDFEEQKEIGYIDEPLQFLSDGLFGTVDAPYLLDFDSYFWIETYVFPSEAGTISFSQGAKAGNRGEGDYVSHQITNRNVLIETFTGRNCGYDPDAHVIVNGIVKDNPKRAWAVNVHAGGFSPTSYPNLNTTDGSAICSQGFQCTSFPAGVVNRSTTRAIGRGQFLSEAEDQLNQVAEVNVGGHVIINPLSRIATITVDVYYTGDADVSTNYLTVAMLQDSIIGSQSGMSSNPSQMLNGQYCHMHVLRDIVTDTWGDAISPTTTGTLISKQYIYEIPDVIGSPNGVPVDLNNLHFLAWVSKSQFYILNVNELEISQSMGDPFSFACKQGSTVTLAASANDDYGFMNWSEDGIQVSTSPEYSFVADGNRTLIAYFGTDPHSIQASSYPANGGTISGSGTYDFGATAVLSATANPGFEFFNWTENGVEVSTDREYEINVSEDRILTANFYDNTNYFGVSAIINPAHTGDVSGAGIYQLGEEATLVATPNEGYSFFTWSDGVASLNESFENGIPEGWAIIDADGDGHNWYHSSEAGNHRTLAITSHTGAGHMMSESFCSATMQAYHPDNFMVTPLVSVTLNSVFSFWACAQDQSFSAEHFGIAVSTGSQTNPADFTTISEWTITSAKGEPNAGSRGSRSATQWQKYTVDLSEYAGQSCYIAIRHFNCYDQFIFDVDDVEFTSIASSLVLTDASYAFSVAENRKFVANFIANGSGKYWNPDVTPYANNMTIMSVATIDDVEITSAAYEIGAFSNGVCRGSARAEYFAPLGRYLFFLTVNGNDDGEALQFRLYDHSLGQETDLYCANSMTFESDAMIGTFDELYEFQFLSRYPITATVNPEGAGTVTGMGNYVPESEATLTAIANEGYQFRCWTLNGETVSTDATYTFTATMPFDFVAEFDYIHAVPFNSGWNWWSTYIDLSESDGLSILENSLGNSGRLIKSRADGYVEAYDYGGTTGWFGTLTAISNGQMYKIQTNSPCVASVYGQPNVMAEHPITIRNGWNWVSFPMPNNVALEDALSDFTPEANDIIKGRTGFSTYYSSGSYSMWYGTLNTLESGQGYMYFSNSQQQKSLVYSSGRSEAKPNITCESNVFQPNDREFADNMNITAVVVFEVEELRSENYEVAAFVNGECRGSVKLLYVEPTDSYVAFLTVFGEDGENLEFRLTDGNSVMASTDKMSYTVDGVIGSLTAPAVLHFNMTGVMDNVEQTVRLYPNPTNGMVNIECEGMKRITVIDAFGQSVYDYETLGSAKEQINMTRFASGVYMVRVYTDNGIINKQFLKE